MPNSYDSAWSRWPVRPGEVWQVGPHIVACGDHEEDALNRLEICFPERPAMTFVDPPWTPSLATGYRTKAGVPRRVDFQHLMDRIMAAAAWAEGMVYVECGKGYEAEVLSSAHAAGLEDVASWDITYYKTRPARLHLLKHPWAAVDPDVPDFTGVDDEDTPSLAIKHGSSGGGLVLDPCTGQGLTAETAAMMGRRFIGIELHPGRMARAVDRLHRVTGERPVIWGTL